MFQNEVKHVVLMPSSTNLGINKEVTHNKRQNNKIVGTQYREIQTIIIIIIVIIIIIIIMIIIIIIITICQYKYFALKILRLKLLYSPRSFAIV